MSRIAHLWLLGGVFLLLTFSHTIQAQSTFSKVHQILQANCSGSACHSGSSPQVFSVDGTEADVYNAIVGVEGLNPAAKAKGNKLVVPGDARRSFLLRKIANGISPELALEQPNEGAPMPYNQPALDIEEIELVRQWILYGAPDTGQVVDEAMIVEYYSGKGLPEIQVPPTPEDEGEMGVQLHIGPVFLAPQQEIEYFFKVYPELDQEVEVYRMESFMNWQSHHFVIFDMDTSQAFVFKSGYQPAEHIGNQAAVHLNSDIMGIWQYERDLELPQGTAFIWEDYTATILNYHIKNYNSDTILAANAYVNIYLRPRQQSTKPMQMEIINFGGQNPFVLQIPPTNLLHTESFDFAYPNSDEIWNVWALQSHTHQLGKDFDIYLRNTDGSRGSQIYEGFYNPDYTFNQGFFDYTHPAVKVFSPLMSVPIKNGFNLEASWINPGPDTVSFGLTTEEEMFVAYMHYTVDKGTSVKEAVNTHYALNISPNPFGDRFQVSYELKKEENIQIEILDLGGRTITTLLDERQTAGAKSRAFDLRDKELSNGIYFLRMSSGEETVTRKIIRMN